MDLAGRFDVVIVGGRVAGCATAIHLVRAGLRVAVVERGIVPSDTLSTHLMQDLGLFSELGVLDEVLACGAPPLRATSIDLAGHDLSADIAHAPWLCLRRSALDEVLIAAAERVGATVLTQTSVVGLLRSDDRVTGVTIQCPDGQRTDLLAQLVVGADGRNSTVARLVNAAKYDVVPSERDAIWGYYSGLAVPEVFYFARRGRDIILTAACDQGLTLVVSQPPRDDERDWRDPRLLERVASELIPPLRAGLENAELVGELNSVRRMDGYFRQATGPGWVLVGDSGHFKDVVVGQGICDALRQASSMTSQIGAVLHDPDQLDAALSGWWRTRDDEASGMYWLAQDLCRVQASVIDHEVWRTLAGSARYRRHLHEVLARHRPPQHVSGRSVQTQALLRATLRTSVSVAQISAGLGAGLVRERERKTAGCRMPIDHLDSLHARRTTTLPSRDPQAPSFEMQSFEMQSFEMQSFEMQQSRRPGQGAAMPTTERDFLDTPFQELKVTGGRLRYRRVGRGAPLLFVHGVFVNSDLWRKVIPRLTDRFDCIVLDLPLGSHSLPMNPDAELSPGHLAGILAEVIQSLNIGPARIVANDSGGALTQILTSRRPELVDSIVLTSCDAYNYFFPPLFRTLPILARIPGGMAALSQCLRSKWLRELPVGFGWVTKNPVPAAVLASYLTPMRRDAGIRRDLAKALKDVRPQYTLDAIGKLKSYQGRVLLVWGEFDKVFPLRHAHQLERDLPNAQLVTLPDTGAFVPEDAPVRLAELIADFYPSSVDSE